MECETLCLAQCIHDTTCSTVALNDVSLHSALPRHIRKCIDKTFHNKNCDSQLPYLDSQQFNAFIANKWYWGCGRKARKNSGHSRLSQQHCKSIICLFEFTVNSPQCSMTCFAKLKNTRNTCAIMLLVCCGRYNTSQKGCIHSSAFSMLCQNESTSQTCRATGSMRNIGLASSNKSLKWMQFGSANTTASSLPLASTMKFSMFFSAAQPRDLELHHRAHRQVI